MFGSGVEVEYLPNHRCFALIDVPGLANREFGTGLGISVIMGATLVAQLKNSARLGSVAKRWGSASELTFASLATLHLADAFGGQIYLKLCGGAEDLKRKATVGSLVFVPDRKIPQLDPELLQDRKKTVLNVRGAPEAVGMTRANSRHFPGTDVADEIVQGRATFDPVLAGYVLGLDVDSPVVPIPKRGNFLGSRNLVGDREIGLDALFLSDPDVEGRPPRGRRISPGTQILRHELNQPAGRRPDRAQTRRSGSHYPPRRPWGCPVA